MLRNIRECDKQLLCFKIMRRSTNAFHRNKALALSQTSQNTRRHVAETCVILPVGSQIFGREIDNHKLPLCKCQKTNAFVRWPTPSASQVTIIFHSATTKAHFEKFAQPNHQIDIAVTRNDKTAICHLLAKFYLPLNEQSAFDAS